MSVAYKDYYAVLGVPRSATEEGIKKAYRRLAREYHPDVAKDKRGAEERFKEINEAYEVLGDSSKRRRYDDLGPNWKEGGAFRSSSGSSSRTRGGGSARAGQEDEGDEVRFGGTGFSDFFESLFSRSASFDESAEASSRRRGGDVERDIQVDLDEVVHGSLRTVTQERVSGRSGRVERSSFQVRVPAGVREGQLIRVAGKGEPGSSGEPGDLYLRVHLGVHPDFKVHDDDLHAEVTLSPWEAVLGATVNVPSLEGPLSVRVPAGARSGQQLRVRGRGLPTPGGQRGDLYVVVSIEVPTRVTEEERKLWQKLAEISKFNPRPN